MNLVLDDVKEVMRGEYLPGLSSPNYLSLTAISQMTPVMRPPVHSAWSLPVARSSCSFHPLMAAKKLPILLSSRKSKESNLSVLHLNQ
jgi:hypothetical protein